MRTCCVDVHRVVQAEQDPADNSLIAAITSGWQPFSICIATKDLRCR
jgi:hypothetical protein